jgi:hypothetical protein
VSQVPHLHKKKQLSIIRYLFLCTFRKNAIFVFNLPINPKSSTNLCASST